MQFPNPAIEKLHHHYAAIYYSRDKAALEAAKQSIQDTVIKPFPGHSEIALLNAAYKERSAELVEAARLEAEKKAKEATEKVVTSAD